MIQLRTRPRGQGVRSATDSDVTHATSPQRAPRTGPTSTNRGSKEAALHWAALLLLFILASWLIYYIQCLRLPRPLSAVEAGKRGFSEERAFQHVKALTKLGPHPVGSEALDNAVQYVLSKAYEVQAQAPWDVAVEVEFFHAKPGANQLVSGLFRGKTLVYANLKHVVVRIKPKFVPGADDNAILVSSHIDSVISAEGAGDCSSCISVMLELVRAISHCGHGFKHAVIFLFNTGEEEGLDGAHSFITQHPWNSSIRTFIDLEALGVGGQSTLFQGGPAKWIVEIYARVAKYPAAQIMAQDLFQAGLVKSATDFQVYKEVANLSGLDFAYMENGAVYHTRNDKLELLYPGSLQHLGENMLVLLHEVAVSVDMPTMSTSSQGGMTMEMVYFDILGRYMVAYPKQFAKKLHISIITQALLLFLMSMYQGGYTSVISLLLSFLSLVLTWISSITFAFLIAFSLPHLSNAAVPYIPYPWLALGLFGTSALCGALVGHFLGYCLLRKYLLKAKQRCGSSKQLYTSRDSDLLDWEAERWLFKAGFVQWLGLLALGTWIGAGSSYIAFLWLVSPALAYGLIDATFSPWRSPRELRVLTLFASLPIPMVASVGSFFRLFGVMIGNLVRFDRSPGATPDWLGNAVIALLAAAMVCMLLIYVLPYAHHSGGTPWVLSMTALPLFLTLSLVISGFLPPFTRNVGRGINVVHVIEVGASTKNQMPISSYVSLTSVTPGKLKQELGFLKNEGFSCQEGEGPDFVTHIVKYGCVSSTDEGMDGDWIDLPLMKVVTDKVIGEERVTSIFIDTASARRWVLAVNTNKISYFKLEEASEAGVIEELVPRSNAVGVDGWHLIQFVTDRIGPQVFNLTLFWSNATIDISSQLQQKEHLLLKLRTDVNTITPKVEITLEKLPEWCVIFGKSSSPYPLTYLVNLAIDFDNSSINDE